MKKENFIIIWVLAGMVAVLDVIWVITLPIGTFASGFYIWAAFFAAFALWFGWRWLLAIYIWLILWSLFTGFSVFSFFGALGNVLWAWFVWLVFSSFKLNMELKKIKDYLGFFIACTLWFGVISWVWTLNVLNYVGIIPDEAMRVATYGWIFWDAVVSLVIWIPLFKYLSPVIKRISLFK